MASKLKVFKAHTFMMCEPEIELRTQFRDWADGTTKEVQKGADIEIQHTYMHIEETVNGNGSKYKIYRLFVFYRINNELSPSTQITR